jgi:DNA-binding response OmpR family regulator
MRLRKIMLVCSEASDEVEKCLLAAGCWVAKVRDGEAAVSQAKREIFDASVLVSTGGEMDLAETVFNLRDINGSMQIIIVADREEVNQSAILKEIVAHTTPNTQVFTIVELENQLVPLESSGPQRRVRRTD